MNDRALFPAVFFRLGVSEVNIDSWTKARGEGCGRAVEEMCHVDLLFIWKETELIVCGRKFKVYE